MGIFFFQQWEQKVEKGQEDFEKISEMIRKEMSRFEVRYAVHTFCIY